MAPPVKFAHIVLKTRNYEEMVAWWCDFLEASVRHGNDMLSFLSYDDEHHRMAIARLPNLEDRNPKSVGVEHFAFTYADLDALLGQFERMQAKGVHPYWMIHHGITLSAYYRDPDGNQVETQVDVMSMDEADAFMHGPRFAENPIGKKVDFEALLARYRGGEAASSIVDYVTA
jgi:catechol-2,3-dioxygenase